MRHHPHGGATPHITALLLLAMTLVQCGGEPAKPGDSQADTATTDGTAPDSAIAKDETHGGAGDLDGSDDGDVYVPPKVGTLVACSVDAPLPAGLVEIAWDDGKAQSDVSQQASWSVVGKSVREARLHQAVRFDLDGPVRVHGFRIQYGQLPKTAQTLAGLYRDFGHNGFDFWAPDPIYQVACPTPQLKAKAWITFKLPQPLLISQPGLVYVAHERKGTDGAAWAFDGTIHPDCLEKNGGKGAQDCCNTFARCHSAWNFPDLTSFVTGKQANFAWNGLSIQRPLDYLVRLVVEPLPAPKADQKLLIPLKGPKLGHRMAWGDFDNDGWVDLFDSTNTLYRNDNGTLTDVTEKAGIKALQLKGSGGVWGDFDNDGHLDLFVFREAAQGGDTLLRNQGDGTFKDVTAAAGISDVQSYNLCGEKETDPAKQKNKHTPTPGAAWVDIDADGKLDLYLSNFICWSLGTYYYDTVWHNEGGGKFSNWTGTHGFFGTSGKAFAGRGVNPADADGDGDVDLLINNYRLHRNLYFRNNGDGSVSEVGRKVGLAGHPSSSGGTMQYGHSIGTAWGDLNEDGFLDMVVANLAHPRFWSFSDKTQVLINDGKGGWKDNQGDWSIPVGASGLRYQETHTVPLLADFDLDGHLDLAISATYDGRPTDFYWGLGDGHFSLDVLRAGLEVDNGWGMAVADVNHDGAPDLAAKGVLFLNSGRDVRGTKPAGATKGAGELGHWLQVGVIGDGKANRAAIGATVRVWLSDGTAGSKAGERVIVRVVSGGNGQGCQDSPIQHIGLGARTTALRAEVVFPGGAKTSFAGPFKADQRVWLYESGKVVTGWAPGGKKAGK